uniref:HesA/MoeB/ThiF family protein n=1 Tax=Desulfobacca acetoxidans TaxID=60893 RepID=A0A7V4LCK1_9BACT
MPEIGWEGQERLKSGKVLVVGAGGLGSAALLYLAAAGVGRLMVVDGDRVELSNLQRQILHSTADLGRPKVESAQESLNRLNPHCAVEVCARRLDADNVSHTLSGWDLVLDCSDNFPTRFVVAECCWQEGKVLVSAAVQEFTGQLLVVEPRQSSPCYRCLLPEAPAEPAGPLGIVGAVAGVMGCLQALEALKLLIGLPSRLTHHLLAFDGLRSSFRLLERQKAPGCPLCGGSP